MGYHPIYDLNVDIGINPDSGVEVCETLESIVKHKLTITEWVTSGPTGGNPNATVRGTRKQITAWINEDYDPSDDYKASEGGLTEEDAWLNIVDIFCVTFVA